MYLLYAISIFRHFSYACIELHVHAFKQRRPELGSTLCCGSVYDPCLHKHKESLPDDSRTNTLEQNLGTACFAASPTSSTSLPLPQPRSPTARSVVSLRGDSGQLQSPSYPANYPNNAFVVYDVALRQRGNFTVLLTYDLDVEESDDCTYDYILVIADQRHRLCGKRSGVLAGRWPGALSFRTNWILRFSSHLNA